MSISVIRDSVEYVEADIYSRTTLVGTAPAIAITYPGVAATWLTSDWTDTPEQITLSVDVLPFRAGEAVWKATARTAAAVTFSTADYANKQYNVRAKLTDSPESPIFDAYVLNITD